MIREDLLQQELKDYKECGTELKPMKYNRNFVFNLFNQYKHFGMTVNSYCCYGEERCCWSEVYEKGAWFKTLKQVRLDILQCFKYLKHYLRSIKKYGSRMYVYQDSKMCHIYIYGRDFCDADYHVWFDNESK